jgi:hypothetical protein
MLVAGFSCKDFSPLNRRRRNIDGALVKEEKEKKSREGNIPGENVDNMEESALKTTKSEGEAEIVTGKETEAPEVDIRPPAVDDPIEATNTAHDNKVRGMSGDTFFAVLDYAAKYRPPIVILENVCNANWYIKQAER